jgi:hypothetical protein
MNRPTTIVNPGTHWRGDIERPLPASKELRDIRAIENHT